MVEGNKIITELRNSKYKIREIFSTNPVDDNLIKFSNNLITEITQRDLQKISFLQHPKDSVALCELPTSHVKSSDLNIVLDGIQDPGNLGTIIRLADWFGIDQIVCSEDTVDVYNPKVIQATMGSFTRVNVVYTSLSEFLGKTEHINLGTDMEGKNIYEFGFPEKFNLILGNEGNGIRPETVSLLHQKITIPRFGKNKLTESLNVSMAAGIILGEIFSKR